ncbi:MAG TPA: PilT/PilU family type 4a pilus ATPase [Rhodocyclaceae bacterium]|jgi:twitching motility protein PilU|nr:PilT/PilU family type 4a pilus ATPase [Rhodocyclaceae bacterium]HMW77633.1 PilT/PilU family type 4a pilus ATPase [Rhodocyclaceae bacterium]HNE41719.1 PilT/PilU family type 4a pilus ATPase [Rhodocyclaceae bacterium]HNM82230.1 PilT/PilU family type 4a pilus ATPase [Rhodocyclaceae bacterium]HNP03833.1 PilT/PilU family type 4a pilus ATPase [Rhodocyclaceae bacterium]
MSEEILGDQYKTYMHNLLKAMVQHGGSDLFIARDFSPTMKVHGTMKALSTQKLTADVAKCLALTMMNRTQREEFDRELECNFAISLPGVARFRVNVFQQQASVSMVIRTITSEIPNFEKLGLPAVLKEVITAKRGLVLVVGGTGSGKSTTMAAMIDHRNSSAPGHIITVEDPVEYVHVSKQCLVSHREVGIDTLSWHNALKNTLRQAPDVILIGEIRDLETMEHALAFAETGHLCMGTLHANNANQTLDRVVNFFPDERKPQVMMDLATNLKAVISQRLIRSLDGKRKAAIEILLNTPTVAELLSKGQSAAIKPVMDKSRELGMQTFDQALFDLFDAGHISYEEAIRNADSTNELRLAIKLKSRRGEPSGSSGMSLAIAEEQREPGEGEEIAPS